MSFISSCVSNPSGSLNEYDSVDSKVPVSKDILDVIVEYSVLLDGDAMACRFCDDYLATHGPFHFLYHLAGTENAVEACKGIAEEAKKEVSDIFRAFREKIAEKTKRKWIEVDIESSRDFFKRRRTEEPDSEVENSDNEVKKSLREETCGAIAEFFNKNAIPLNVVKSDEFKTMCDLVSRHGLGFKPPSFDDIKGKHGRT